MQAPSLDAIAREPTTAAELSAEDRRIVTLQCAAVLAACASVPEPGPVAPELDRATSTRLRPCWG